MTRPSRARRSSPPRRTSTATTAALTTTPPHAAPLPQHAFAYPKDEAAHHALQEIIMSYKTVRFPNGKEVNRKQFTVGGWCRLCALLLTDLPLEEADVK